MTSKRSQPIPDAKLANDIIPVYDAVSDLRQREVKRKELSREHAKSLLCVVLDLLEVASPARNSIEEIAVDIARNLAPDVFRSEDVQNVPILALNKSAMLKRQRENPQKNLLLTIVENMEGDVGLDISNTAGMPMRVGDGISYWNKPDSLAYAAITNIAALGKTGFVRIHATILYSDKQIQSAIGFAKPRTDSAQFQSIFEISGLQDKHGVQDRKAICVVVSDAVTALDKRTIHEVFPLVFSWKMYENASPDGRTEEEPGLSHSKVLVCCGNVNTSTWNVEGADLDPAGMQAALKSAALRMKFMQPASLKEMLMPIRLHVSNSVCKLGACGDQRTAILSVACPFLVFAHFVILEGSELSWNDVLPDRTWTATFASPKSLEIVFGKNWFSIEKKESEGYIRVRGPIELCYSHKTPGKMRMYLNGVVLQGSGAGAEIVFDPPVGGLPLHDALAS